MTRQPAERGYTVWLALVFTFALCAALAAAAALYPQADGAVLLRDEGTTVDASHADQGYVMVRHTPVAKKLKMRITKGDQQLTYDLASDDSYETFLLGFGSGSYKIQVFLQVSGKRYSNDSSIKLDVELADETLPFLYPNQYVHYTADSSAVAKAAELCGGLESPADRLSAVRKYVVKAILYDYVRASTVTTGYLPVVDEVLAEGKGICFDYAALTACMLRTQGIPTKLVIGYADTIYHAWNEVWIDGEWQRIDTTAEANHMKVKKYTDERVY